MGQIIIAEDTAHYTESDVITEEPAICSGCLLGTDSTNDPQITIQNNPGTRLILPTATYDASALGLNGYQGQWRLSKEGLSLLVTCAGTVYVVPLWKTWWQVPDRNYR